MDVNILKRKNLKSVYLVYKDKVNKQVRVKVHFIDKEVCYLQTDLVGSEVRKPRKNQRAQILAYTINGQFIGKTKIVDTTVTLREIMYTVAIPEKWEYVQTRSSIRKQIALPFTIKYSDGYEVKGETYDISAGGISFTLHEPILPIYYKLNAEVSIDLTGNIESDNDHSIHSEVKHLRDITEDNTTTYVYRFLAMDSHNINILKLLLNTNN